MNNPFKSKLNSAETGVSKIGLGCSHESNIMIDLETGEPRLIDFGKSFKFNPKESDEELKEMNDDIINDDLRRIDLLEEKFLQKMERLYGVEL